MVWQVKYFPYGIKGSQKRKIIESLERVVSKYNPDIWILCIPINLNISEFEWIEYLRKQYPNLEIRILQADGIIKSIRQDISILNSYFIKPQNELSNTVLFQIINKLDGFSYVPDLIKNIHEEDPLQFYNGKIPSWSNIVNNLDARREKLGHLWDCVAKNICRVTGRIPFILLTGRSGDGKSTILKRFALELINQGYLTVFFNKPNYSLTYEQFRNDIPNVKYFIIIDNIAIYEPDSIKSFFEGLCALSIPAIVVGAETISLWTAMDIKDELLSYVEFNEISVDELTKVDIDSFLDKWQENPELSRYILGKLRDMSYEEQVKLFQQKAKKQLIVALLEARYREEFVAHIMKEINSLKRECRTACQYVSALHRLGLVLPLDILDRLLVKGEVDRWEDIVKSSKGLLIFSDDYVITRHGLVADVIFGSIDKNIMYKYYENIIKNTEDGRHVHLLGRMISLLLLRKEDHLAEQLLKVCCTKFPKNVVFKQMYAFFLMRYKGVAGSNVIKIREIFEEAINIDPTHAPIYQSWGMLEFEVGNIERARELYSAAIQSNPFDVYTYQSWGILEKSQGNICQARDLFRKALEVGEKKSPAYHAWAIMEKEQGNIAKARELLQKAIDVDKKHVHSYQAWAMLEKEQGNIEKARELLYKAIDLNPFDAPAYHALAMIEREQHNVERALELLRRIIEIDHRHAPSIQSLALIEKERGDIKKARELFERAVNASPRSAFSIQAWALMEKEQGNIEKARDLFSKAIEVDPRHAPAIQAWALMEKEQGNIRKARELFKSAIEATPRHAPAIQAWALMEKEQGNVEKARDLFSKAIEGDPRHAQSIHAWALMEIEHGNIENARMLLERTMKEGSENAQILHAYALLEKKHGSIYKARELLQMALKKDSKHLHSYQALAIIEKEIGNIERARELFSTALKINPNSEHILHSWAILENCHGRVDKAKELFQKALNINSRNDYCIYGLALIEKKQGRKENARNLFKKAIEIKGRYAPYYHAWALLEMSMGNYGQENIVYSARWLLNRATQLDSPNILYWIEWSELENRLGEHEKSKDLYSQALNNNSSLDTGRLYKLLASVYGKLGNKQRKYDHLRMLDEFIKKSDRN